MTESLVGVLAVVGCSDRGDDATRGPTATVRIYERLRVGRVLTTANECR